MTNNLELELLTARAALPRAARGTTVDYFNRALQGKEVLMVIRGKATSGVVRTIDATAHGLVAFVNTVDGQSESAPVATLELI